MRHVAVLALFAAAAGAQSPGGVLSPAEIAQLEAELAQNPTNRTIQVERGRNYAYAILGITELGKYDAVAGLDPAKAAGPLAQHARDTMGTSMNAGLLAERAKALWTYSFQASGHSVLQGLSTGSNYYGEDAFASQTLDRAIGLDQTTPDWRYYRIPITVFRTNISLILPLTPADAFPIVKDDLAHLSDGLRAYSLADAAKLAVRVGALDDAGSYAGELLGVGIDWNYGSAVYFGNMVLGQIALRRGDGRGAIERLLASGKTPGSPQLNSFGPNMTLARELLTGDFSADRIVHTRRATGRHGAPVETREAVLQFFDLCKAFWTTGGDRLQQWPEQVRAGVVPEFGANLLY